MNGSTARVVVLGAAMALGLSAIHVAAGGQSDRLARAQALVDAGRVNGARSVDQRDDRARDAAKKDLDEARKLVQDELKASPACEKCVETLAAAQFYRSYFRFANEYDDCVKTASQGLLRFPANTTLALYKGLAHYNQGQFEDAAKSIGRFAAAADAAPDAVRQFRPVLEDSRQKFLSTWYHQGNFYQSNESRLLWYNPQTFQNQTIVQITRDYELGLGEQAFTQLAASAPMVQDQQLAGYLEHLVGRLVQATPGPEFTYRVTIVGSPEINAVTPPGHILVNTGLLAFVDSESQLAGVLAHELAHNYAHHSARRVIKSVQAQMLAGAVTRAIDPQGAAARAATLIGTTVAVNLFLDAYSRFEEKEADLYGSHILFNAGYNPTAMSSFFLKMYRQQPRQPIKFLSTHPPVPDRAEYLTDYFEAFPLDRELALDSQTFQQAVKSRFPSTAPVTTDERRAVAPPPPVAPRPAAPPSATAPPATRSAPPAATIPPVVNEPRPSAPPANTPPVSTPPVSTPPVSAPPPAAPRTPAGRVPSAADLPPVSLAPSAPAAFSAAPANTPVPASPPPIAAPRPAAAAGVSLGTWGPVPGQLRVEMREKQGVVEGVVVAVSAEWLPAYAEAGTLVLTDGHIRGDVIAGRFLNVPGRDACPLLPKTFSPAVMKLDGGGRTMTVTFTTLQYVASSCQWNGATESKTVTWRRLDAPR